MHDTYGANPRLLPSRCRIRRAILTELPRIEKEEHEMNWVQCSQGQTEASCPFEYAARLTETMLLGVVSLRSGKKLEYDAANMRITNGRKPTTT